VEIAAAEHEHPARQSLRRSSRIMKLADDGVSSMHSPDGNLPARNLQQTCPVGMHEYTVPSTILRLAHLYTPARY
jgi:hypothetical protein